MQYLPIHPSKRHPLTGEPLQAVWVRPDGRAVWPIIGASPDDPSNDPSPSDPPADPNPSNDPTPEDFESKFNSQRSINRKLERDSKPWFQALKEHGLTANEALELINKGMAAPPKKGGDPEPVDAEKIRREAQREADEKANARIVRAEVRALAAETFADPADASLYVDLSDFEVDDDGEVNAAEIKKALGDVLKAKPHLAKKGAGPRPDPSQGSRGDKQPDPGPGMARLRHAYANTNK